MAGDNPFAEPGDGERTVIVPTPGGRKPPEAAATPAAAPGVEIAPVRMPKPAKLTDLIPSSSTNPLINCALPLLDVAMQLRNRALNDEVESLRDRIVAEINAFERATAPLSLPRQTFQAARYALCALIDDIVLNTPWGSRSSWSRRTLAGTFQQGLVGGEGFWDVLKRLKQNAAVNLDLLELYYYCISLGFMGRYRIEQRGASELFMQRQDLYNLIRNNRGEYERSLSPHWQGVRSEHRGLAALVPNWVIAIGALGVIALFYAIFTFLSNARTDKTYEILAGLLPTGRVTLAREAPPPPPPPPAKQTLTIQKLLQPEIDQGLVVVLEDAQSITIRITMGQMFAPGSATLEPQVLAVMDRIGQAANTVPGPIQVVGHTDNQPIKSLKFPSNYQLSLARAQTAIDVFKPRITDPSRLQADGRADSEPLVPNDTPAHQQQNRRIEIILVKSE